MWEREEEYKVELEQVIQKAGTSRLERLASLALEDERTCYKHVLVLLEKQYRKCGPNMRGKLHLLYCVSTLLRQSRKQQGARDRYAERLQPLTSALVIDLRLDFSAQIDKLLKLWRMENVYSAEQLLELESGRSAQALRQQGGLQSKSPSGSLTEASAQDPHVGMGDASGSGRSSAIQSYPRFPGGRGQPSIPGAMPSYQPPPPPEGQDPYSADSNPNGSRAVAPPQPPPPPPPPTLPPPPPPLIPPGLLGPVGPPGMLPQASAAAAAAAAAGLFQQGQLSGFLGAPVQALMQQGTFMSGLGAFHGANISNGITGALPGAAAPGLGVGVGVGGVMGGGMGGAMPFQGPSGAMPPGLTLPRPPLYPQPPVYNNQGHQGQNQGSRALNTLNYNRYNQSSGRMPPGLGPSSGPGQSSTHVPGQGWQGRFGGEAHGSAPTQGLPPPPPRPPPGSPPHGVGSTAPAGQGGATAAGANGIHRGGGGMDSSGNLVPPGLGPSASSAGPTDGGAGSASSTQGVAATGYIRPSGRRSRWELERDSSGAPVVASATAAGPDRPAGSEPLPKRPALAAGAGGGGGIAAPEDTTAKPSVPVAEPQAVLPASRTAGVSGGDGFRADESATTAGAPTRAEGASLGQPQEHQQQAEAVQLHPQQDRSDPAVQGRGEQQAHEGADEAAAAVADTPMDVGTGEGQAYSHVTEDVAVADGKADPDSVVEPDERLARLGPEEAVSGRQHGVLVPAGVHLEAALRAPAAEGVMEVAEVDDGGSSSAEPVCPAAQHHDSTAPSSPGRPGGGAEQGDSRDRGGNATADQQDQRDLVQDEQQRVQQQQQRRASSIGVGESGNDRLSMANPEGQAADGVAGGQPEPHEEAERQRRLQRQQQEQEQVGETKAVEAVTSTNQPSLVEQGDAQLRASHDLQSAEHATAQVTELPGRRSPGPGAQEAVEQAVAQSDGAQVTTDDSPREGARRRECEQRMDAVPLTSAVSGAEAAPAPDTAAAVAGLAHAAASGLAELDPSAAPTAPDAPDAKADDGTASAADGTAASAQGVGVSDVAPVAEAKPVTAPQPADPAPPAPAQSSQQVAQPPPLQSSGALLLSSYDDPRVPLQLEELELGELDDTWLE